MNYEMEELVPIVAKLAEQYTSLESTSITYEKAGQLMESVLYCIHEVELSEHNAVIRAGGMSAQQAYETGAACVEKKARRALKRYHEILPEFDSYENRCLYDTFLKGLPEFFRWYDIKFEPQNTILTLDYPVLKDLSEYTGIDRIYEFLNCIRLEQNFLRRFPKSFVLDILSTYHPFYKDIVDNICEIVLAAVIERILVKKSLPESELKLFLKEYYGDSDELLEYLSRALDGIVVRLKNAKTPAAFSLEKCQE